MELTGWIKSVYPGFMDEGWKILLELNEAAVLRDGYEDLKNEKLHIKLTKYRRKRSRDANSYYWELVGKLSSKMNISMSRCHNMMLRSYGTVEIIDGSLIQILIPDTDEAYEDVLERETYHLKPTSQVKKGNNGQNYRSYILLKGSHAYNVDEMSALINGLVAECQAQGIETMPPEKLDHLMYMYEIHNSKN